MRRQGRLKLPGGIQENDAGLLEKGLTKELEDPFTPNLYNGATIVLNQLAAP